MEINFRQATIQDSEIIGSFVVAITTEICERTNTKHFDIDLSTTVQRCRELLNNGHYAVIIGFKEESPIAVATLTETYALYAGGKIGVVQEFYVSPEFRSAGVGSMLVEQIQSFAKEQNYSCIELCTPPLPEFERTLNFYIKTGLIPVGGRKMRQALV